MGCNWCDNLYSSWVVGPYGPNCSFWAFFVGGSSLPWYSWPRASFTLGLAAFANCPGPAQWMVRWLMGEINGQQLMILVVDYGWLVVEPTHLKSMLGSNWIILPGTLNVIHNLPRKRSLSLSLSLEWFVCSNSTEKEKIHQQILHKICTRTSAAVTTTTFHSLAAQLQTTNSLGQFQMQPSTCLGNKTPGKEICSRWAMLCMDMCWWTPPKTHPIP